MDSSESKSNESAAVERERSPISKVSGEREWYQVTETEDYQKLSRDCSGLKKGAINSEKTTLKESFETGAAASSANSVLHKIAEEILDKIIEKVLDKIGKGVPEESIREVIDELHPIYADEFQELPITLSSLPILLTKSGVNNPSDTEEILLKHLMRRGGIFHSIESKLVVAQSVKCSALWTSDKCVDEVPVTGYSFEFDEKEVLNLPSILLWSDLKQKLRDSVEPSEWAFSVYDKLVPFNNCFKVKLPAVICYESDLNSNEIFVKTENLFEVTIPLLLYLKVDASMIEDSQRHRTTDRALSSDMNRQEADNVEEELTSSAHYSGNTERIATPVDMVIYAMKLDSVLFPELNP